MALHK